MRNGTPSAQVGEYMKKFYTIGETAALLGVSTDTLRYYDRIGLLKPARVDAESKYRYYSYTQFHYIDRIKYLQKLGMSLNEIRRVIHTGRVDKLIRYLKAEKIRLEKELTRVQHRIEDTDWYINYFTYMENQPGEESLYTVCLPERYVVKCPCIYGEPLAEMEIRLAGVKASPPYIGLEYKRQYGYVINREALFQGKFYPEQYFIFLRGKPDLEPSAYDVFPAGEYVCFRTKALHENWDQTLLRTYFGANQPALALALEFEDNLREYQDAWYEMQLLAGTERPSLDEAPPPDG